MPWEVTGGGGVLVSECERECVCVCAQVFARACVCMRERESVHVCERERETARENLRVLKSEKWTS